MENNLTEVIFSNLSSILTAAGGILTAVGVIVGAYYQFVIKKKTADSTVIGQLQEHVRILMERDEKKDAKIEELQKENMKHSTSVQTLGYALDEMKEDFKELKTLLADEQKEKRMYKEKFQKERMEKLNILEENKQMKHDIEKLKTEIKRLKAQLGIEAR